MNSQECARTRPSAPSLRTRLIVQGRVKSLVVLATPSVVFLVAQSMFSLTTALAGALLGAIGVLALEWIPHRRWKKAGIGLVVASLSATASIVLGEPRAYFLVPALVPVMATLACIVSLLVGRPLVGVLLSRVQKAPSDWSRIKDLRQIYVNATALCLGVSLVNMALQIYFYSGSHLEALAVLHVVIPALFAGIIARNTASVRSWRQRSERSPAAANAALTK